MSKQIRMNASPAQASDILTRLDTKGGLSTKDFEHMGYSFENFLRYAQFEGESLKKAHDLLRPALEARAEVTT
jgi:hypothetical protein